MTISGIWGRYIAWSGRLVADISATLVLRLGLPAANIINSLFLTALIWIIAALGARLSNKNTWQPNYLIVLFIYFIYWVGNPKLGHTTFWIVGSANYLWTNVFNFGFALAFIAALHSKKEITLSRGVLVSLLGVLGGCSNENTALITWLLLAWLFFITYKNNNRNNNKWLLVWLVFMAIGAAILILAPGNFVRIHIPSNMEWYDEPLSWRIKYHLIRRLPDSMMKYWESYIVLLIGAFCLRTPKHIAKNIMLLILMAVLSNLIMISAPAFPKRALQGGYIYMLVATAIMLYQITEPNRIKHKKVLIFGFTLCLLHWSLSFGLMARSFYATSLQDKVRTAIIKQGIKNNLSHIEIPEFYFKKLLRSREKFDVFFSGKSMARYYGTDAEITEFPVNKHYDLNNPPLKYNPIKH